MTENEEQLLNEWLAEAIPKHGFLKAFPHDVANDPSYVVGEMRRAMQDDDAYRFELLWPLLWLLPGDQYPVDLLNELLLYPHHQQHQFVAKTLQDFKSPSTIPFVEKALESGFDYLQYTCSEDGVIAKWFSWLLFAIGTPEAIGVMRRFSLSENEGIRAEMNYRLAKVKPGN